MPPYARAFVGVSAARQNNPLRSFKVEQALQERIERLRKQQGEEGEFADVMVVGGGVSGIQASLDLAGAGYRVVLVETGPAIGGHMAQLDKTYPTNDCSM